VTRTKLIIIGAIAAVAALAVGTAAIAGKGGDDNELPITGAALEQASEAALAHTGEGRVTGTEIGDEESLYEIEVTLNDGSQVDVQLDENFAVVGTAADDDTEPESEDD
jgi:hypothetical protein